MKNFHTTQILKDAPQALYFILNITETKRKMKGRKGLGGMMVAIRESRHVTEQLGTQGSSASWELVAVAWGWWHS